MQYSIDINKPSMKNKIITFFIIIMPILEQYNSPIKSINIAEVLLMMIIPFTMYELCRKKYNFPVYWIFFLYTVICTLMMIVFQPYAPISNAMIRLTRDFFYAFVILVVAYYHFDVRYAVSVYEKIVICVCTYILIQTAVFYTTGTVLPWVIKGLDINNALGNEAYIAHFYSMYVSMYRPTSIFLEPGMFAQYVLPGLIFALYPFYKEKANIKLALFISLALVCSTSGQSIVIMAVIWITWVIRAVLKAKNPVYSIGTIISFCIGLGFVFYLSQTNAAFQRTLSRFDTINVAGGNNSVNLRILRGMSVFSQLGVFFKLFGVGFGNITSHLVANNIETVYDSLLGSEYMNTQSYFLVSGGAVGLILFLVVMYKLYKKSSLQGKYLIILILILCMMASIYSSAIWIVCMSFIIYANKEYFERVKD